jgi:hypothetical protein
MRCESLKAILAEQEAFDSFRSWREEKDCQITEY